MQARLTAGGRWVASPFGLLVLLTVCLPWAGWFSFYGVTGPATFAVSPLAVFAFGTLGIVGVALARLEPAVGVFVLLTTLNAAWSRVWLAWPVLNFGALGQVSLGFLSALVTALWTGLGAVLLILVQCCRRRALLGHVLVVLGVLESLYALHQWTGADWPAQLVTGDPLAAQVRVIGSIGNENFLGAFLALTGALAPWALLPVFVAGLLATHSVLGTVALGAGLLVRWWPIGWQRWLVGLAGLAVLGAVIALHPTFLGSGWRRVGIWVFGWLDLAHHPEAWLFGFGPGAWWWRIPRLQRATGFLMGEVAVVWEYAHNVLVQVGYEQGVAGLAVVGWGLYRWRRLPWHPQYGGAVVALAVLSLGLFIDHVPLLAFTGVVVLGLASGRR